MQQGDDEPSTPSLSSTNNDDGDDDNDEGAETISISPRREQSRGIMVDANTVGILSLLGS